MTSNIIVLIRPLIIDCKTFLHNIPIEPFILKICPFLLTWLILLGPLVFILAPLHELGHYFTAKVFSKRKPQNITFYIRYRTMYCSTWKYFSDKEIKITALAGSFTVVFYCLLLTAAILLIHGYLSVSLILRAILEIYSNLRKTEEDTSNDRTCMQDRTKLKTLDVTNKLDITSFIIRFFYPLLLIVITIVVLYFNAEYLLLTTITEMLQSIK